MAVSTIADTIYTYRFLKLLVTPFRETEAYKLGIIDETGKRLKDKKVENQEERNAFNLFHRLVFNLKRLIETAPGGKSRLASYIAALALLREHYDVNVEKVLTEMNVNTLDKKKILKEIQPKKKKKAEEEIANTTAGVAMIPTHMKFKAFVRRKRDL